MFLRLFIRYRFLIPVPRSRSLLVQIVTTHVDPRMLPPAPETPLQMIKCGCSMSVCKHLGVNLYCTDLCCRGAGEDSCKILPVVNMLMTFKQLFSCGFRYFLAVSTRMPYCPILTFDNDSER